MAASDCSFCGKHGVPCVLRRATAAICGPCASAFASRTDEQRYTRERFERELEHERERALAREAGVPAERAVVERRFRFARDVERIRRRLSGERHQPSDVAAEGDCSFCGARETYPVMGIERFRGESEDVTVTGQPVRICSTCIERAVAAARPS